MNLLHVIASMDPKQGGVSQAVRTIIFGLTHLGISNEVVSLDGAEINSAKEPLVLHTLGKGKGPWAYNSKLLPWLIENFSRFDAVIVHGLWLYPSYATQKAIHHYKNQYSKNANTKILKFFVMPHGMLDPYFQRAKGRKLKALRNIAYWQLIENKVINEADAILYTCEQERLLASEPFQGYTPKKEIVVGLGVEEPPIYNVSMREAFMAKCFGLNHSPYLLFLSRIHEKKGVDLLVKAFSQLVEKSNHNASLTLKLVIAGPGLDSSYGKNLQKYIASNPRLHGRIIFTDMLTGDAKWGAFYGCDAFVLPSHQENFGIAVVEALASKKPVLISNQVNIWREIIEAGAGITGEDSLPGTSFILAYWLKLSSNDKNTMSQKARTCFEKNFGIIPAATRLLKAISQ